MTTQINLNRVWASTGSATDPNATNYNFGWVVEIPTYQEFNYVLKGLDTNLLVLAEQSYFTWDATITYSIGAKVLLNNITYTCRTINTNVNPALDNTHSYWVKGNSFGGLNNTLQASHGLLVKNIINKAAGTWLGNELTLENANTTIAFNSDLYNNWVLGNVKGEMVLANTTSVGLPDGRNISGGQTNVYRLYHEGNKPVVADVNGAVPINLINNKLYARRNSNWEELQAPTQAEAEAGVATTSKVWSALRVKQATVAIGDARYKPINSIDVPTGTILQGYFTTPPAGFLVCDGTTLSRSTYANLWAYAQATGVTIAEALWAVNVGLFSVGDGSSTFRVPDLRDMFLRSKSATRALGSFQADAFKSHTHRQQNTTAIGGSIEQGRGYADGNLVYINGYQVEATGGAETRPVNIALSSIIKY